MGDLTKNHPKCFLYYKEKRLIEHLISNFKSCGISKIVIVTGYKSELFKQFETFLVFNKNWENSNMLYSLYCSLPYMSENSIVTYADIFYEKNIIKKLKESKNNFCVAYDPKWLELWSKRFDNPLSDAETFKLNKNNFIKEIGNKTSKINEIQGQYMGIIKFKGGIFEKYLSLFSKEEIMKMDVTTFMQKLLFKNIKIKAISYEDKWAEIDSKNDIKTLNF